MYISAISHHINDKCDNLSSSVRLLLIINNYYPMGSLKVRFLKKFFRAFGQARHLINCLNRLFQSLINCRGYQLKHVFRVYLYFSPSPRSRQQQYLLDLSLHQAFPMSNDINEDLIRIQEDRNGSWY